MVMTSSEESVRAVVPARLVCLAREVLQSPVPGVSDSWIASVIGEPGLHRTSLLVRCCNALHCTPPLPVDAPQASVIRALLQLGLVSDDAGAQELIGTSLVASSQQVVARCLSVWTLILQLSTQASSGGKSWNQSVSHQNLLQRLCAEPDRLHRVLYPATHGSLLLPADLVQVRLRYKKRAPGGVDRPQYLSELQSQIKLKNSDWEHSDHRLDSLYVTRSLNCTGDTSLQDSCNRLCYQLNNSVEGMSKVEQWLDSNPEPSAPSESALRMSANIIDAASMLRHLQATMQSVFTLTNRNQNEFHQTPQLSTATLEWHNKLSQISQQQQP